MKKAVIVTPNYTYSYNVRIKYLEELFFYKGYEVTIISSDFNHRTKEEYKSEKRNLELLHVPRYKKNLSFKRIYSHKIFAKKSVKRVNEINPNIIYVSGPPNYLYKYFAKNKAKNKLNKLIFEIGDMWPETLPIKNQLKKILALPLNIWKRLRDKNIVKADNIIFQCDFFRKKVCESIKKSIGYTVYMCKESSIIPSMNLNLMNEMIETVYVGSINNIIDIDLICKILNEISKVKKVKINIIGDGESRDEFIKKAKLAGAEVEYYGMIYDEIEKEKIYNKSSFAFNIMKETVCVGLTMKSIDYFEAGIPLINNIGGDTFEIINKTKSGINIFDDLEICEMFANISIETIIEMKRNSRKVFDDYFDKKIFFDNMEKILNI